MKVLLKSTPRCYKENKTEAATNATRSLNRSKESYDTEKTDALFLSPLFCTHMLMTHTFEDHKGLML